MKDEYYNSAIKTITFTTVALFCILYRKKEKYFLIYVIISFT